MSRREADRRLPPFGGSSRHKYASDSGFESSDGDYYASRSANPLPPPFTGLDVQRQWENLPNLQVAYRKIWEENRKFQQLNKENTQLIEDNEGLSKENKLLKNEVGARDAELRNLDLKLRNLELAYKKVCDHNKEIQDDSLDLRKENQRLNRQCLELRMGLKEASPPASESSSSSHRRSGSGKHDKSRDHKRDSGGIENEHLLDRFASADKSTKKTSSTSSTSSRPPQTQMPVRQRRQSVSYSEGLGPRSNISRPKVEVPVQMYGPEVVSSGINYTAGPAGMTGYAPAEPRQYPHHDGFYVKSPLPPNHK